MNRATLRHPSLGGPQTSAGQSTALLQRIAEKKQELENLKQLKDLSAEMASQMEVLSAKLSTLSDGTEAVATVLSNWHNVLRAISMASEKIPQPKKDEADPSVSSTDPDKTPLPQTLVRIPVDWNEATSGG